MVEGHAPNQCKLTFHHDLNNHIICFIDFYVIENVGCCLGLAK
jgi:hypothetical protein